MSDPARDEELLERFVQGDHSAFTTLARRHEDRLFALALRMTGDRADALDATQEALLSLFRRARSFRSESAFSTWLFRICVNACRDLLRKKGRAPVPRESPPEPPNPSGSALDDAVAARIDVSRALALLPEEYREAVVMHDLGGVAYEEIAVSTGVPLGTVKSRISRGRRRLAELLEQPQGTETSK